MAGKARKPVTTKKAVTSAARNGPSDAEVSRVRARLSQAGGWRTGAAASVGIREFRASFSEYIRKVQRGATLAVTDRGAPIAVVLPAGVPEGIARMIAEGRASWSGKRPVITMPTVPWREEGTASDWIVKDREDEVREFDELVRSPVDERR